MTATASKNWMRLPGYNSPLAESSTVPVPKLAALQNKANQLNAILTTLAKKTKDRNS